MFDALTSFLMLVAFGMSPVLVPAVIAPFYAAFGRLKKYRAARRQHAPRPNRSTASVAPRSKLSPAPS